MTLLCIHSYPSAASRIEMLWPWFEITGWPILGVDCEDGRHAWPNNNPSVGIAKNLPCPLPRYEDLEWDDNLPRKFIGTLKYVLENPDYAHITDICIIESDGFFLRKPPPHPGGLIGTLSGRCPPEWNCGTGLFIHTPWWMDRATADKMISVGQKLIDEKRCQTGSPDIFVGKLIEEGNLPFQPSHTWSCNGGGLVIPSNMNGAIEAVRSGAWYVHGMRTKTELEELLESRLK